MSDVVLHDEEALGKTYDARLMRRLLAIGIRSTLHGTSPGAPQSVAESQIGAVSFLHRFGSSLYAHFHYHVVVLDGIFSETEEGGVDFHEASELESRHWQELRHTVQKRVLRYFRRHDLLEASTTADMLTWQGRGGFSIDASVRIEARHRHGLERLVRAGTDAERWSCPTTLRAPPCSRHGRQ